MNYQSADGADRNFERKCMSQSEKKQITLTGRIKAREQAIVTKECVASSQSLRSLKLNGILCKDPSQHKLSELDKKFQQMKLWRKSVMFIANFTNQLYEYDITSECNAIDDDSLCDLSDIRNRNRKFENVNIVSDDKASESSKDDQCPNFSTTMKEMIVDKKLIALKNKKIITKKKQQTILAKQATRNKVSSVTLLLEKKDIDYFAPKYSKIFL